MSTIDEIMQAVYRSQCAASAYETSSGRGKRRLEIDMFAADGEVQAMITAALAEARREGAEAMREAAAEAGYGSMNTIDNAMEVKYSILDLPLPTGKRQAVRLTDEQVRTMIGREWGQVEIAPQSVERFARAIEAAVLAANGPGDSDG